MSVRTPGKLLLLTALPVLALAACATRSTADAAGLTATTASVRPTEASSSPSSTVAPSAPSRTASMPSAPACATERLRVEMASSGVAAGTWSALITFTNRGATPCSMRGWPTVLGIAADGASTRARAVPASDYMDGLRVTGMPAVVLAPGDRAGFDVNGGDNPVGDTNACPPPYRTLRVGAPGAVGSASISGYLTSLDTLAPSCAGLTVSPVHPTSDFGYNQ